MTNFLRKLNSIRESGRTKGGFTLVEVIVVLVIMGILAAIAVPSMVGFIDRSRERACLVNRLEIRHTYQPWAASQQYVVDDPGSFLESVVEDFGGEYVSASEFIGECGGTCSVIYTEDNATIADIVCSLHGSLTATNEQNGHLLALDACKAFILNDDMLDYVVNYINTKPDRSNSLNSTGRNFAPDLNDMLKDYGFDADNSSWRVSYNKNAGTMDIYWSDTSIDDLDPLTDRVRYVKYSYNYVNKQQLGNPTSGMTALYSQRIQGEDDIMTLNPNGAKTTVDDEFGDSWK